MTDWCTPENMNQVCRHGSQRRKCVYCESEWQDERIAELEQAIKDHIKLHGIQFEKGKNAGMERAAEIDEGVPAVGYAPEYRKGYREGAKAKAEAIRKEIEK